MMETARLYEMLAKGGENATRHKPQKLKRRYTFDRENLSNYLIQTYPTLAKWL